MRLSYNEIPGKLNAAAFVNAPEVSTGLVHIVFDPGMLNNVKFYTSSGYQYSSADIIFAHELGHVLGKLDPLDYIVKPFEDNVSIMENGYRQSINAPIRTRYSVWVFINGGWQFASNDPTAKP